MRVDENYEIETEAGASGKPGQENRRPTSFGHAKHIITLALAALVVAGIVYRGISTRVRATSALTVQTQEMAVPTVSVIQPKRGASSEEIVLPGNIHAFIDAPIYARTNGYLKRWYVDIGARVKAGQLLAEIDTPEVDRQLQQARADLATAERQRDTSIYWKPIQWPSRMSITPSPTIKQRRPWYSPPGRM
jgi:multidrug efflux pump subunit AcrA (membrane-fusion protein)